MANERVRGSCLCGVVRFSIAPPTQFCGHCHCSMCRRNHGAGYVTWIALPRVQFRLESGETDLTRYASSDHGTRSFCRRCGSSLFCETTHDPNRIDIVLANMQGPIDRRPEMHIFFDDRAEWVFVDDGLPRLGGTTGLEPLPHR
ncbi:MAG TPA: GFA family protein [Candidatus Binatia bacterium]|nr:GFA family protein [Candidatus Binatia bacterium]